MHDYDFLLIEKPIQTSLGDCLTLLSKYQLEEIANHHKIQNPSKIKKAELIECLKIKIIEKVKFLFNYKMLYFYDLCMCFADQNNQEKRLIEIKNQYFSDYDDEDFEETVLEVVDYLVSYGFVFAFRDLKTEVDIFIFPTELYSLVKNHTIENIAKYEVPASYAKILTDLYGICSFDIVQDLYNRDCGAEKIEGKQEFIMLAEQLTQIDETLYFENETFYHRRVKDYGLEQAILEKRKNFKQYIPSSRELRLKGCCDFYEEDNPKLESLIMFLIKKKVSSDLAYCFCVYIIDEMKSIVNPSELIKIVTETSPYKPKDIDQANEYLSVITDLFNSVHSWFNWGWQPNELSQKVHSAQKDLVLSEEKIQKLKEERNNVPPLKLPKNCHIPSTYEILEIKTEFDKYWGNGIVEPDWFSAGRSQENRLKSYFNKFKKYLSEMPEQSFNMLMDQFLASIWHKNANRGGQFGNQKWDYHVFTIYQQIGEELFTCIDSDGKPFVLFSHSAQIHYDNDSFTCFSILVDMGGWSMCYGPVLSWKSFLPEDLHFLASKIATQLYEQQGFSVVVQFNPVPFWISSMYSEMPVLSHKNKRILNCFQECRFKDDFVPDFPKTWHFEKVGSLSRWINKKNDYLASSGMYVDEKTKKVLLFAHTQDDFYKIQKQFQKYLVIKCEPEFASMSMLSFCIETFKKEPLLVSYEKKFEKR